MGSGWGIQLTNGFEINHGYLIINPYWFWDRFKNVYENIFQEIFDDSKEINKYRNNALEYFEEIVNK